MPGDLLGEMPQGRLMFDQFRRVTTQRWLLTRWATIVRLRRAGLMLRRQSGNVRRVLIILFGVASGMLAVHFGAGSLPKDLLTNYLVATAAMIGGMTAIVFSITIFLLQGAGDLYSSKHFEEYANSWREFQVIYGSIIAITIAFFAAGLYVAGCSGISSSTGAFVVIPSLSLIAVVFALIDYQYELVRRKINPARMIEFLKRKAMRFLEATHADAKSIAKILSFAGNGITNESALAVAYNRMLRPALDDLGRQFELLVDIAVRLAERQEIDTAKSALAAAGEIVVGYLGARKTSSIAMPSSVAILAIESDSQKFLSTRYEYLNRAGGRFVREDMDDIASHLVELYRAFANAAKDIKPIGITHENPILEQVMWSLLSFAEGEAASPNLEVLFQSATLLGEIGVATARVGLSAVLLGVQQNLSKIAMRSFQFNTTVVVNECTSAHLDIIKACIGTEGPDKSIAIETSLRGIAKMTVALEQLVLAGALTNDFYGSTKAYVDFHSTLDEILGKYPNITNPEERARYRHDLATLFEALRQSLRGLSKSVRADSLLAGTIGRLIFRVNSDIIYLLGQADFADIHARLRDCLKWLIHTPYWFVHESDGFDAGSNSVVALSDVAAKTGMLAACNLGDKEIVGECISSISSMAVKAVEIATDTYGAPRIMRKACYLGVLANKADWGDIVTGLKGRVEAFDTAYDLKHPHNAGQLLQELHTWLSNFEYEQLNGVRLGDPADIMLDLVVEADIHAFIAAIWGT